MAPANRVLEDHDFWKEWIWMRLRPGLGGPGKLMIWQPGLKVAAVRNAQCGYGGEEYLLLFGILSTNPTKAESGYP